jgi:carboxylesterase type B
MEKVLYQDQYVDKKLIIRKIVLFCLKYIKYLEWIEKYNEIFGNDLHRINLFAESAGTVSVSLNLLSPRSRPFFNTAIL